jgi:mRNA interferase HigB
MHVISRKALLEFGQRYGDSRVALDDWYRIVRKAKWQQINDVRAVYP